MSFAQGNGGDKPTTPVLAYGVSNSPFDSMFIMSDRYQGIIGMPHWLSLQEMRNILGSGSTILDGNGIYGGSGRLSETNTIVNGFNSLKLNNLTFDSINVYEINAERINLKGGLFFGSNGNSFKMTGSDGLNGQVLSYDEVGDSTKWIDVGAGGGGNLNNVCEEKIFKVAHGFSVGSVVFLDKNGDWLESQANTDSTIHDAIIISVPHVDTFNIQFCGLADITGQTYSAGVDYYTSETTAGDLRNTAPTEGYVDFVGVGRGGTKIQLKNVNAVYTGSEVVAATLDQEYPGASVLYSLRLLNSNYNGNAVRVRRDNDDAEQDIGFTNGVIDETALTTFCGANSCYVTIWYDQSVNGNNAVQVDNAKQPIIVNSGVVEKKNNLVTITATGSQTLSFNATVPDDFTETSVFAVFTDESASNNPTTVLYDNSFSLINQTQIQALGTSQSRIVFTTDVLGTQLISNYTEPLLNSLNIYCAIYASSSANLYMNTNAGINNNNGFPINSSGGHIFSANGLSYWIGSCSELIVYPDDRSSDRNGIETNLNDYYATY